MSNSPTTSKRWRRGALMAATAALIAGLSGPSAFANVNRAFPGESPGVPAYARTAPGGVFHTDEWAAVPFFRLPTCVPDDFNLLTFFDAPRAFGCPLTVEGHEVSGTSGPGAVPNQVVTREAGSVPVWFASWPELQLAMSDGVLTIDELSGLDSLVVGTADFYHELLHPDELIVINARGSLSDGRSFRVHVKYSIHDDSPQVSIEIR